MSIKWKNWYQNEVDKETKKADSRDKVTSVTPNQLKPPQFLHFAFPYASS